MNSPIKSFRFLASLFAFAVSLPVLGSLVFGQEIPPAAPPRAGQGMPPAEELLRVLELPAAQKALVLTDEQRKKIEDISFNVRKTAIQQQAALQLQKLELERMMRADNPDRAAIDKKIPEVVQAQTAIMRARINALMDVRAVLTKEQRDRIGEFIAQRVQREARPKVQQAQPKPGAAPPQPPQPPQPQK